MAAMAAARAGEPELAVKALLIDVPKNRYHPNGHNYQRPGLTAYLPGNGGLLAAIAMMAGYLAGGVEKDVFTAKSTELKIEAERLRERAADAKAPGEDFSRAVMEAFDFAQQAAERWRVSGTDGRRAILTRALLKRSLSATSLEATKRRPFDVLIEGPSFDESQGDKI